MTSFFNEASSPLQHCLPQWNHVCSLLHAALELKQTVHNLAHTYRYSIRKYFESGWMLVIVTTSRKLWQCLTISEENPDGLPSSCPSPARSAQTTVWETAWSRMLWWRQVSIIVSDFPLCGLPEAHVVHFFFLWLDVIHEQPKVQSWLAWLPSWIPASHVGLTD